jgi:inositol hexakisphosphate/diphosphoinositol-pentakisphosphate kinase
LAFGQTVCGFDLLRTKGRSYVCDVNGWSFVKNSTKYFDDASVCLRAIILQAVAPEHTATVEATEAADQATTEDDPEHEAMQNQSEKSPGEQKKKGKAAAEPPKEELRAVLAVIRHGDRTP